jgi:Protein of unknown function (DUF3300)
VSIRSVRYKVLAWLLLGIVVVPLPAMAQDAPKSFKPEELDQLVAPIALHPDPLLAQLLMASTYPLEIVQAARFVKDNPKLQSDQLNEALKQHTWDDSVKSMVFFPQVLTMMNDKLDWLQKLGDAFLAQQQDLMAAVQRMRARAQAAGQLKSTPEQKVIVEPAATPTPPPPPAGAPVAPPPPTVQTLPAPPSTVQVVQAPPTVIRIEPADPQVVYVPSYNPTVVYGAWRIPPTHPTPPILPAISPPARSPLRPAWQWARRCGATSTGTAAAATSTSTTATRTTSRTTSTTKTRPATASSTAPRPGRGHGRAEPWQVAAQPRASQGRAVPGQRHPAALQQERAPQRPVPRGVPRPHSGIRLQPGGAAGWAPGGHARSPGRDRATARRQPRGSR